MRIQVVTQGGHILNVTDTAQDHRGGLVVTVQGENELHEAVQENVRRMLGATTQQLALSTTPRFPVLLDQACHLFERFDGSDQVLACAYILGMLWATWEGMATTFEQNNKLLLSMRDRLVMFCAMLEVVYRESSEHTKHPDCPKPTNEPGGGRVM